MAVRCFRARAWPAELASLASGPGGHFFFTPSWFEAVSAAKPKLRALVLGVEDPDGRLLAACPFWATPHLGTTRLYAGLWGTYGGILARTPDAAQEIRRLLESECRRLGVLLVRVHDFDDSMRRSGVAPGPWSVSPESCQVLDLPNDPQILFHDAFTSRNRNKIRKAEKHGVRVRRADDAASLGVYAALHRETARRWEGGQVLPERFFRALAEAPTGVDVWLAENKGEVIAGLLNFNCGGQIMNWGNVSRQEAWSEAPNNLLHWRAIEAACLDPGGPRLYNFGGSGGLSGVEAFKSAFGARTHTYSRWEYSPTWVQYWRRLQTR